MQEQEIVSLKFNKNLCDFRADFFSPSFFEAFINANNSCKVEWLKLNSCARVEFTLELDPKISMC
jgi:hypothetical protein